jgi:hypothetical protein
MTSFRNVYTALLLVIAVSTHRELARQVTYLKAEKQILRRRLPDRIGLTQREKNRLIRFAKNVGSVLNELPNREMRTTKRATNIDGCLIDHHKPDHRARSLTQNQRKPTQNRSLAPK